MYNISLEKIYSGKVRELYKIDEKRMLMLATDRLSAFDVIFDQIIPGKGEILTQISNFWFKKLAHIMPNHFTGETVFDVLPKQEAEEIKNRAVVCKKLTPIKIESIVRGYLTGTGWEDYQATGMVCGHKLPTNLKLASKLPNPIFTPSSKAEIGDHDQNITITQCEQLIGKELTKKIEECALRLYTEAANYALTKGIIICDTKFEFGLDENGTLTLMDEVLTPDSSRFWPADQYQEGANQVSFDKQFIRDWLNTTNWNKKPPAPQIPAELIEKTRAKYQEAYDLLTK